MPDILNAVNKLVKQSAAASAAAAVARLPRSEAELWKLMSFEPRPIQLLTLTQRKRFSVEVWHRRAGKTVGKIVKLITRAVFCPHKDGRYAFLAPTYSQAEDIAWAYLKSFTEPFERYGREVHEAKLAVTLPTVAGSTARIRLYGVDSPKQRLRGLYLDGAVFDEFQDIPMSVWSEQVRPMLTDVNRAGNDLLGYRNQWCDFVGTPRGRNQLYVMFTRAQRWHAGQSAREYDPSAQKYVEMRSSDWYAALYPVSRTRILTPEELAEARRDMGEARYLQEFECSFDAVVSGSVFGNTLARLRKVGRIGYHPVNPGRPVHTAWDLGWDDATAIWFFQTDRDQVILVDYEEYTQRGLPDIVRTLEEKGYTYGRHYFPHDVSVSELGTGKSRRSVLTELGVRVTAVPRVKHKVDAIVAADALLDRCWFDEEKCAEGLDKLTLYRREFDERLGRHRDNPVHDANSHAADAFMTLACGLRGERLQDDRPPIAEL